MQHDLPLEGGVDLIRLDFGLDQQRCQREHSRRVGEGGLWIGLERCARVLVGIPQGNFTLIQPFDGVICPGNELAGKIPFGKRKLVVFDGCPHPPEKQNPQDKQRKNRPEIRQKSLHRLQITRNDANFHAKTF